MLEYELNRGVGRLGFNNGDCVEAGLEFLVGFTYGNDFTIVGPKAETIALSGVAENFKMCHD